MGVLSQLNGQVIAVCIAVVEENALGGVDGKRPGRAMGSRVGVGRGDWRRIDIQADRSGGLKLRVGNGVLKFILAAKAHFRRVIDVVAIDDSRSMARRGNGDDL